MSTENLEVEMRLKMKAREEGNISEGGPVPSGEQEEEVSAAGPVWEHYGNNRWYTRLVLA